VAPEPSGCSPFEAVPAARLRLAEPGDDAVEVTAEHVVTEDVAAGLLMPLVRDAGVPEQAAELPLPGEYLGLVHGVEPVDRIRAGAGDQGPVLTAPYPVNHDLRLRGRGVRLVPSYFCHTTPIAIADPELPPVVVYPVRGHQAGPRTAAGPPAALAPLLGTARSRVLDALTVTVPTGAIAARLGMPASTVSGHLKVLRAAGLVRSERVGTHVVHRLTGRGRHLLGH
jgi:DNA-binding transcriptional ArsR family regulator